VTQRTANTRTAERLRSHDISELAVMVRFGELVVAVAALRVSRIVMADEAVPADVRSTRYVRIGDAMLPAWNLGTLLGFSEPPVAWLVMRTRDEPSAPEIALGSGPCIAVASHDGVTPLPAGVLSSPQAAVIGVFVTDAALRARGVGPLGVRVDPMRLIGSSVLAAARRDAR
jgi:hypothetical protein